VPSAEGGIVESGYERVTEWIELTEEGVQMEFYAAGSDEHVDLLKVRAEGRFELTVEWLGCAARLALDRPGKHAHLEVTAALRERPWFLVREELVKLSMELGGDELARRIVDEMYTTAIDP